ncbi:hypothetical protein V6N11_059343 [Hibiscus sabdariffa]|uniref:Endonuclease/exonuclease/phosphatase domain-containing protein n=1 Tax=Hibiscus sabdariffa TaxID=183260 RepID=A0ABR2U6V1_9ROSI
MSVMAWNVRGLGNKETVRALKNAAFKFKSSVIFLSETKKKKQYLEKIRMKMKMNGSFYVDPIGIAGELPIKGRTFTWSNHRSDEDAILEKLDRVLVSLEWSNAFPKALRILNAALASDHAPIFLLLKGVNKRYKKDFKFEAKWVLEEDCLENVKEGWPLGNSNSYNPVFSKKLNKTRSKLRQWSKMKLRRNKNREEELKEKIKFLQGKQLSKNELEDLRIMEMELHKLWESEEKYWH